MSQVSRGIPLSGPGSGSVTELNAGVGITLTPNPITATGTIALTVPVVVANGGTGITAAGAAYAPIVAGTTPTNPFQTAATGIANVGYVLTSSGAAAVPEWKVVPAGSVTLNGDTGSAVGNPLNIHALPQAGASVSFSGAASTLSFNTTDADSNVYLGEQCGVASSGNENTAVGFGSLSSITNSNFNVCVGAQTMNSAQNASGNVAIGYTAMSGTVTGVNHTALGRDAMNALDGGQNCIAIGYLAGTNWNTAEEFNIAIGSPGVLSENNTTRIGFIGGSSSQTACYMDGIFGVTAGTDAVLIAANGRLGTVVSSARFKKNIVPMNGTERLYDLNPVNFEYKETPGKHYGLIAEEVYHHMPDLVNLDKEGNPYSVRYHDLSVMLLAEVKKLNERIKELENRIP